MSARDKDTGAEQRITISESSNLDPSEVERMVEDAERHRDEDRRLRELTDARNALDAAAYQVENLLSERGDAVPVHERARADNLVAEARQALKDETPIDRLRTMTGRASAGVPEPRRMPARASRPGRGRAGQRARPGQGDDGDDVIDAEFTTHE